MPRGDLTGQDLTPKEIIYGESMVNSGLCDGMSMVNTLVKSMFNIPSGYLLQPWYRWPIEIDGLPWFTINSMVIFHGKL